MSFLLWYLIYTTWQSRGISCQSRYCATKENKKAVLTHRLQKLINLQTLTHPHWQHQQTRELYAAHQCYTLSPLSLLLTKPQANVHKITILHLNIEYLTLNILHLITSATFAHNGSIYLHNYIHILKIVPISSKKHINISW